jgi:hypothetical protein
MNTKYGISILAEDCQEALRRILEMVKSGVGDNIKALEDIKLLEGLLDEKEITAKDIADEEARLLAEYNATHSKCCDYPIVMGRCSKCLEGV